MTVDQFKLDRLVDSRTVALRQDLERIEHRMAILYSQLEILRRSSWFTRLKWLFTGLQVPDVEYPVAWPKTDKEEIIEYIDACRKSIPDRQL